ncbi:MAG: DUF2254 domain-containing protein [Pseudonocardiales bacterium]|nr:DUF2254 domain-containing protein [Pseudonocardiales bacterium]
MRRARRQLRPRYHSGLRRSLREFLAVPLAMVIGSIVLAVITAVLDRSTAPWLQPAQRLLSELVPPGENQAMLRTVAPAMLTAMSIAFFLLLTLVHRMADVFTWVVVEQFLLRRTNQVFFGFFGGLAVYYIVVLAAIGPQQAVFSTTVALVLSVLALAGLLVFGYLVLDQLRPTSVVQRIGQLTLATYADQRFRLRRFRDAPLLGHLPGTTVRAERSGYLIDIDIDRLVRAITVAQDPVEIEFHAALGSHIVVGSDIAAVRASRAEDCAHLADAILDALTCGRERKLAREAVYGVHQLSSVAWAASTHQDPEAALVAVGALHTLLAHWTEEQTLVRGPADNNDPLPVVYPDTTIEQVLSSLASIIVATGQSGQHQTCAQVLEVFSMALPRLSPHHQRIVVQHLHRVLPTVTMHIFSRELERALAALGRVLYDTGYPSCAHQLSTITSQPAAHVTEPST